MISSAEQTVPYADRGQFSNHLCDGIFFLIFFPRRSPSHHRLGFEGTGIPLLRMSSISECNFRWLNILSAFCTFVLLYVHTGGCTIWIHRGDRCSWTKAKQTKAPWWVYFCVCSYASCQMVWILYSAGFGKSVTTFTDFFYSILFTTTRTEVPPLMRWTVANN